MDKGGKKGYWEDVGGGRLQGRVVTQSNRKRAEEGRRLPVEAKARATRDDMEQESESTQVHEQSARATETMVDSSDDDDTSISSGTLKDMERDAYLDNLRSKGKGINRHEIASDEEDDEETYDNLQGNSISCDFIS